jgi:hypothetical protein
MFNNARLLHGLVIFIGHFLWTRFCKSLLLLFTATIKEREFFFSFHFFIFSFSLRFMVLFLAFGVRSHTMGFSFLSLGADKGIWEIWLSFFFFFAAPFFFFLYALGSVHDRSCIGVTLPLRFSLLCGLFPIFFFFFFFFFTLLYTSFTAPDRYEQADQAI